jgi:hypothetical protein
MFDRYRCRPVRPPNGIVSLPTVDPVDPHTSALKPAWPDLAAAGLGRP